MYLDPEWEAAETAERPARRAWWRQIFWLLLVGLALTAIAFGVRSILHDDSPHQVARPPMIRTVTLPPPPPPPKPQERPPEPQKTLDVKPREIMPPSKPAAAKPDAQKPTPANANPRPPGSPLTAAPGNGANPYGLQAGNGGGDTIGGAGGEGGEGAGAGFGFYALKVQSQLQAALMHNDKTRRGTYSVVANLWLNGSGRVDRVEITRSSGDPALDDALSEVLSRQVISEAPPKGMPQPIRTRIAARG